jgi:hypothetical protein
VRDGKRARTLLGAVRRLLDKLPRLNLDPLVDVLVIAASVRHEVIFHLADLVEQDVIFALEIGVLRLQLRLCLLEIMHPFFLLLATFGCSDPVTL